MTENCGLIPIASKSTAHGQNFSLPPAILQIVQNKGTEPPFSGTHAPLQEAGTYLCRRCGLALFRTDAQFHSGCGWPSFDQTIPKTVTQQPDADGIRTELL